MDAKNVNRTSLKRLSNYKNVLYKLKALGFVKVFSDNLGDAIGVSAAQVRSDLSKFGITSGNKKGGYSIDELLDNVKETLGKDEIQKVIVVGCGKMGNAIMNYSGFPVEGMRIVAGFDTNPTMVSSNERIPIYCLDEMERIVSEEKVRVAIMTVPESAAAQVFDLVQRAGIKGVLNFAPLQLRSTETCLVNNINIALELESMFYMVKYSLTRPLS
ncbi:MAG: redox-sensing transcriptional repressor Rex [Kiritimatiellaeota bacterium]|nr:redox-sensing transcriptional repressor Rex [Kiritimatiellota bacterium]